MPINNLIEKRFPSMPHLIWARAFAMATSAGRMAYESGMGAKSFTASASSPLDWVSKL